MGVSEQVKIRNKTTNVYTEWKPLIDSLSDEDAGRLIKAIYAYADEGVLPDFEGPMRSLFTVIRTQIDLSREAYKAKCEKNRDNSRKRKVFLGKQDEQSIDGGREPSLSTNNDRCPPTLNDIPPNPKLSPKPKPDIDDVANTHIINEDEVEVIVEEDFPFNKIWEMYDKKVGNMAALRETWKTLSANEKRKIFEYVPIYVRVRPDRKYRKNFENFLVCRTWETEPITLNEVNNGSNNYRNSPQSNETRRELAQQNSLQLVSKLLGGSEEPTASFDGGEEDVPYSS